MALRIGKSFAIIVNTVPSVRGLSRRVVSAEIRGSNPLGTAIEIAQEGALFLFADRGQELEELAWIDAPVFRIHGPDNFVRSALPYGFSQVDDGWLKIVAVPGVVEDLQARL